MTKENILKYLSAHKEEFKEKFGVVNIGLFGSYARGDANENSDVDIVIEMKPKSLVNRLKLKEELASNLNLDIDIGYFSSLRHFIQNEIRNEIIYV